MKTFIKSIAAFLIVALLTINPTASFAQNGDPPPPPGEHGENGNQVPGGGAPVGDGLVFLTLLAVSYASCKLYRKRNRVQVLKFTA
jgi:hypothetical protein